MTDAIEEILLAAVHQVVEDNLAQFATSEGDRFRQWFYPESWRGVYTVNPEVDAAIVEAVPDSKITKHEAYEIAVGILRANS